MSSLCEAFPKAMLIIPLFRTSRACGLRASFINRSLAFVAKFNDVSDIRIYGLLLVRSIWNSRKLGRCSHFGLCIRVKLHCHPSVSVEPGGVGFSLAELTKFGVSALSTRWCLS